MNLIGKASGSTLRGSINKLRVTRGYSAYEVAVINGFSGTEEEWLASLQGADGKSAYQVAVANGFKGTEAQWIAYLGGAYATDEAVEAAVETYMTENSVDNIPDYVEAEAERVAAVVQSRQNANTITALLCSDLHTGYGYSTSNQMLKSIQHCGQAMALIKKAVHIDFAAMLGDLPWDGGETAEEALEVIRFINGYLHDAFVGIPGFRARGNHDCLYGDDTGLTDDQIFANIGKFNAGAVFDTNNRVGGYCYRDFDNYKLRVICVNTCEASDGSFAVSDAQNTWLQTALDLSTKESGWYSIIICHHPPDWTSSSSNLVQTIAAASNLLCVFHGHVHGFKVDKITGTDVYRIAIPNACYGRENEYGKNGTAENSEGTEFGETETYSKTANTAEDTAFCVVTIDLEAGKVYADHYGAGYSRVIAVDGSVIETHDVTNELTNVSNSSIVASVSNEASYVGNLTADSGYVIDSVTITMGGVDITDTAYSDGRISIASVTGDVVITATAVVSSSGDDDSGDDTGGEVTTANLVPSSIDTDGSVYNGTGYKSGYRLNSSASVVESAGSIVSGFIPYSGEVIQVCGANDSAAGYSGNYLNLYDSNFNLLFAGYISQWATYGATWAYLDGKYALTIDPAAITNETVLGHLASTAYIRASLGVVASADDFAVYLGGESSGGDNSGDDTGGDDSGNDSGESSGDDSGGEVTTSNLVPTSLNASGEVFVDVGYQFGYTLSDKSGSYALLVQAGAIVSGYIPYSGGVITIGASNYESSGWTGNYLALYSNLGNEYGINKIDFVNLINAGAVYAADENGKYILTIDPSVLTNSTIQEQLASATYIRAALATIESGDDFVVTITASSSGDDSGDDSGDAENGLVSTSIDTDGSIYNGTGYKTGYRLSSSGVEKELAGGIVSGYIPLSAGEVLMVLGSSNSAAGTTGNYLCLYDSSFTLIAAYDFANLVSYGAQWSQEDISGLYLLVVHPDSITNETVLANLGQAAYFRASMADCTSDNFFIEKA